VVDPVSVIAAKKATSAARQSSIQEVVVEEK
jgi:hypothetical protein